MDEENREYMPEVCEDDQDVDDDGAVKFGSAGIDRLSEEVEKGPMRGEIAVSDACCCFELSLKSNNFESNSSLEVAVDMLGFEFISRCCSNMLPVAVLWQQRIGWREGIG